MTRIPCSNSRCPRTYHVDQSCPLDGRTDGGSTYGVLGDGRLFTLPLISTDPRRPVVDVGASPAFEGFDFSTIARVVRDADGDVRIYGRTGYVVKLEPDWSGDGVTLTQRGGHSVDLVCTGDEHRDDLITRIEGWLRDDAAAADD